jgi:hypothetical protein
VQQFTAKTDDDRKVKVSRTSEQKELLDIKNKQELDAMKTRGQNGVVQSVMEDYYNIILFGEYSDEDVGIMLKTRGLLEKLAVLWQGDERVMELQKILLMEFFQQKP